MFQPIPTLQQPNARPDQRSMLPLEGPNQIQNAKENAPIFLVER
jgi:hypothetical protein